MSSSSNPSVFGQSVSFTATVKVSQPGPGTATGTVTFKDGGVSIGTGLLNAASPDVATLEAPLSVINGVAIHTITASCSVPIQFVL